MLRSLKRKKFLCQERKRCRSLPDTYLMQIKEFEEKVISYWNSTAIDIYKEEIDNVDKKMKYLNKAGNYNNDYWELHTFKRSTSIFKYWINNRYDFIIMKGFLP